jgi:hypothetical protein
VGQAFPPANPVLLIQPKLQSPIRIQSQCRNSQAE